MTMSTLSVVSAFLATYAVHGEEGFDVDATVEKFRADCERHQAIRCTEDEEIGAAVRAAFASVSPGCGLNMPFLESKVLQALNATDANFKDLTERTAKWVRAHAQGEAIKNDKDEVVGYTRPNSEFVIAKGKHGGVYRREDKEAADAAREAAKKAKK